MKWCISCMDGAISRGYELDVKEQIKGKCVCECCGECSTEEQYYEVEMAEIKVARIVFKNKSGWSTGKHAFHKGTEKALNEWAIKKARGREFQVQILDEENALHFWNHAVEVEEE